MQNQHDLIPTQPLDASAAFFEQRGFAQSRRGDAVLQIRISRNTSIALVISLLVHLLLLITLAPKLFPTGKPITTPQPLTISLNPPTKASEPPPPIAPLAEITKPVKKAVRKPIKPAPIPTPRVITATKPPSQPQTNTFKVPPVVVPKKIPKPTPEVAPEPLPGEDMQAYIKRQKEYQLRKQGYTSKDIQETNSDNGQSEDSRRNRAIAENTKFGGSNGIFEIKSMGLHNAEFSFKGWKDNNVSRAISENISVDVPDGQDIKLAIIRKMITIIRREYSGDFNWDSHRLDRVVVQSARPEDTAGLESFLMLEFFGPGGAYRE